MNSLEVTSVIAITMLEDGRLTKWECATSILNKNIKFKVRIMYIYIFFWPPVWINLFLTHSRKFNHMYKCFIGKLFSEIIEYM